MKIKTFLRLAFGIALLALIVSQVDIREVWELLRNVEPLWLVIGFGLALPGVLISTLKWMILLRVQGMSMKNVGILDGDLVAVHRTPEVRSRQIVVARLEDEVTVRVQARVELYVPWGSYRV